jgi:hypothetical protein
MVSGGACLPEPLFWEAIPAFRTRASNAARRFFLAARRAPAHAARIWTAQHHSQYVHVARMHVLIPPFAKYRHAFFDGAERLKNLFHQSIRLVKTTVYSPCRDDGMSQTAGPQYAGAPSNAPKQPIAAHRLSSIGSDRKFICFQGVRAESGVDLAAFGGA